MEHNFLMKQSLLVLLFFVVVMPFAAASSLPDCQTLNASGNYELANNVTADGCFVITADNVSTELINDSDTQATLITGTVIGSSLRTGTIVLLVALLGLLGVFIAVWYRKRNGTYW